MNFDDTSFIIGMILGVIIVVILFLVVGLPNTRDGVYADICKQINKVSSQSVYQIVDEGWYWEIQDDVQGPFESEKDLILNFIEYIIRSTWDISPQVFVMDVPVFSGPNEFHFSCDSLSQILIKPLLDGTFEFELVVIP